MSYLYSFIWMREVRMFIKVIPNVANVVCSERIEVERNSIFLFVGRLVAEKNPEILAVAANKLDIKIVFAGAGILEDAIRNINIDAYITGWLTHDEVTGYIKKARCLVFPSKWYEAHPLTVLEALSFGVPVIVSDSCAGRDDVIDGENGLWFQSGNVESLCNQITKLQDDEYIRKLSKCAYDGYWSFAHNMDDYYKSLLDTYESVLSL